MPSRDTLDDYYMLPMPLSAWEPAGYYTPNGDFIATETTFHSPSYDYPFASVPQETEEPSSSPRSIVQGILSEAELRRKSTAESFKATVLESIKNKKKNESQGSEVVRPSRVAAPKLSELVEKVPSTGEMKMAFDKEAAELNKRKEEFANQSRVLKERLEEVARKEEIVNRRVKELIQKKFTASLTERALKEKGALESAAMLQREMQMLQREERMVQREEQMLQREEQMLQRKEEIVATEDKMLRLQRQLNGKAQCLNRRDEIFSDERYLAMKREAALEKKGWKRACECERRY
ncbi:hypothetical protein BOTCAL_0078g00140 [Botryotinia calthae]|uniref:Uncharacterized protein n=1 Tax=Botryotinia calthae TaxID=38488 RepID=A0A4Y8DAH2_9HELO|nr:hypothetical protein BOTCAL_0078g00140 [Botryotinia calthae]